MSDLDASLLRKLAEWDPGAVPVTSIYLAVDGRRFPRRQDYELRLDDLLRSCRAQVGSQPKDVRRSVEADLEAVAGFVRGGFERGGTRGLAVFSASGAGLWEEVRLPWPVRNRAVVGPAADVRPLEAFLETYESFCTALVDFQKARLFVAELGRIEEQAALIDDVPNRHDQGGWAQMRFQRHVDVHRQQHLKHVAETLFALQRRRGFDHLILAGAEETVAALERDLHDYLRRRVRARINLPMTATAAEVLERSLELEQQLEAERERAAIEALRAAAGAGDRAVTGLTRTLAALAESRVERLIVDLDRSAPGVACEACGTLAEWGNTCRTCGGPVLAVPDVVESAVAATLRQGGRVEPVSANGSLAEVDGIGAFLRF
jgi:peptide chain release factor subunit 1